MKKLLVMLLALTVLLSMAACGGEAPIPDETDPVSGDTQPVDVGTSENTEPEETAPTVSEEWGVLDDFSFSMDGNGCGIYIRFPYHTGIPEGTGLLAKQGDGTLIILDGHTTGISPEVDSVQNVFPAYFEQTEHVFYVNLGIAYKDSEFKADSKEMLQINGYEMCKFVGTHSYVYKREDYSCRFVAYATQLKDNGAYVYWFVQDMTDDQSMFETLEEHTYNMALTLKEIKD